jgi:hypothetical protein
MYDSIENVKNVAFVNAAVTPIFYTYHYYSYFYIILIASIIGIVVYKMRYFYFPGNIILTLVFHICITIILYITSLTAIN